MEKIYRYKNNTGCVVSHSCPESGKRRTAFPGKEFMARGVIKKRGIAMLGEVMTEQADAPPEMHALADSLADLNVTGMTDLVAEASDLKRLGELEDYELTNKGRSTVLAAVAKRREEMEAAGGVPPGDE